MKPLQPRRVKIENTAVAVLFALALMSVIGCGGYSPKMLHMPLGAEAVSQIDIYNLKKDLSDSNWNSACNVYFDGIFDYRLPDMVVYRDGNDNWRSGLSYQGGGDTNCHDCAQRLFGEQGIWVLMLSDKPPTVLYNKTVEKAELDTIIFPSLTIDTLAIDTLVKYDTTWAEKWKKHVKKIDSSTPKYDMAFRRDSSVNIEYDSHHQLTVHDSVVFDSTIKSEDDRYWVDTNALLAKSRGSSGETRDSSNHSSFSINMNGTRSDSNSHFRIVSNSIPQLSVQVTNSSDSGSGKGDSKPWRRTFQSHRTSLSKTSAEHDTIGYNIHRTSLAYTKPIGDLGLSELIGIAASLVIKTAPPPDVNPIAPSDSVALQTHWRSNTGEYVVTETRKKGDSITKSDTMWTFGARRKTLDSICNSLHISHDALAFDHFYPVPGLNSEVCIRTGLDTIYSSMIKFRLGPGTLNRISIAPTIVRNGVATQDDVGMNSNLSSINNTFEDADPSWMNIGVGLGVIGGSPVSIADYPTTNGYLLLNFFFDRPMLPFDNRSWGPVLGLGLTSGLFNHIFLGGQASVSAFLIGVPAGIYDQINFPLIIPAIRWLGRDYWGGTNKFFIPLKISNWTSKSPWFTKGIQLNEGLHEVIDFSPMIPLTISAIRCLASAIGAIGSGAGGNSFYSYLTPVSSIFRNDWWSIGPGSIRVMAGGDYGPGRDAECLIGLSYDL